MWILAIAACRDDEEPAAFEVPAPDRSRYAGCVSETRTDNGRYVTLESRVYDGQGWEIEYRSADADGVDDTIELYEGRNAWGLYTSFSSEAVGISVDATTATYDGAFWTSQERWISGRLDQRWTYSRPSERELAADVDLEGDGVVEQVWQQTLNGDGRPEFESLTDVDRGWLSDETWTWDGDRLLEDVYADLSGGWTVSQTWGAAPGPDRAVGTWFDELGAVEFTIDGVYRFDADGREESATLTIVTRGVAETQEAIWTWSCP